MGSESVIIDQSDSWSLMLIPSGVSTIVGILNNSLVERMLLRFSILNEGD